MNGSFGVATRGSIALDTLLEENNPSPATIRCLTLLTSSSAAEWHEQGENGLFDEFFQSTMELSFKLNTSRWMALFAIVETNKSLLDAIRCPNL